MWNLKYKYLRSRNWLYIFTINVRWDPIGVEKEVIDLYCDYDSIQWSWQIHLCAHGTLGLGIFHHSVHKQNFLPAKDHMNNAYLLWLYYAKLCMPL